MSTLDGYLLKNKLALITGCTGGIGRATALTLARNGCSIAVHYNTATAKADDLVIELRSLPDVHAYAFQADLCDYDNVRKLHADVVEKMGHPDILFNNAGVTGNQYGRKANIQDVSIEEFENTWKGNAGASFLLTQLCLPYMLNQKYGRIVFCSSVAAVTGGVVGPHYASSKAALHGIVHWISMRYSAEGITCNAVAPALIVGTTMFSNPTEEHVKLIPVGRLGVPEEIASIVELLITNAYMTNKIIVADGGWTATGF